MRIRWRGGAEYQAIQKDSETRFEKSKEGSTVVYETMDAPGKRRLENQQIGVERLVAPSYFADFLRRKKIIGYHKQNYRNIVRYFQKLLALNHLDAAAVEMLRQQIETEEHLTEREWFLRAIAIHL